MNKFKRGDLVKIIKVYDLVGMHKLYIGEVGTVLTTTKRVDVDSEMVIIAFPDGGNDIDIVGVYVEFIDYINKTKELTVQEISDLLGYEVKVVK